MNSSQAASDRPKWYRTRAGQLAVVGYLPFAFVAVACLMYARDQVIAELGTPEALAQWRAWRDEVRQHQEQSRPVAERRVPTSDEPPQLVLLRDHFAGVLGGTLVIVSFLYGFVAFVTVGSLRQRE